MKYLTASLEDYIEIVYILKQRHSVIGITDIAQALSISKASVSKAINILKEKEFISQERYGKINLTQQGEVVAKNIYHKHQVLSQFLAKILGVNPQTAEIDACKIEHILSRETVSKMEKYLSDNT